MQLRSLKDDSFLNLIDEVVIQNSPYPFLKMSFKESHLFLLSDLDMQIYIVKLDRSFSLEQIYDDIESVFAADIVVYNVHLLIYNQVISLLGDMLYHFDNKASQ